MFGAPPALQIVQPFSSQFFTMMQQRMGTRAKVTAFTEPVFTQQVIDTSCRPDGLLVLHTGQREWRAIVEAKIGNARLEAEQLEQYVELARTNEVDALITISNQLTPRTNHLPYQPPSRLGRIQLFHWSWPHLTMLAELLLRQDEIRDREQNFVLKEMVRYFDHESTGVACRDFMGPEWSRVAQKVQSGAAITARDPDLLGALLCWHEQLTNLRIKLTRDLHTHVTVLLRKGHRNDRRARLEHDARDFAQTQKYSGQLDFPDLAGPVTVVADAARRTVSCKLQVLAPTDRQRPSSRVNWLLRQLEPEADRHLRIDLNWERGYRSSAPLSDLRSNPDAARLDINHNIRSFELVHVADLGTRFGGSRQFVAELEACLQRFHPLVATLEAWQSPMSGHEEDIVAEDEDEPTDESGDAELSDAGGEPDIDHLSIQIPNPEPATGEVMGRRYAVYSDGSIEVEMAHGVRRFDSFVDLQAELMRRPGDGASVRPS